MKRLGCVLGALFAFSLLAGTAWSANYPVRFERVQWRNYLATGDLDSSITRKGSGSASDTTAPISIAGKLGRSLPITTAGLWDSTWVAFAFAPSGGTTFGVSASGGTNTTFSLQGSYNGNEWFPITGGQTLPSFENGTSNNITRTFRQCQMCPDDPSLLTYQSLAAVPMIRIIVTSDYIGEFLGYFIYPEAHRNPLQSFTSNRLTSESLVWRNYLGTGSLDSTYTRSVTGAVSDTTAPVSTAGKLSGAPPNEAAEDTTLSFTLAFHPSFNATSTALGHAASGTTVTTQGSFNGSDWFNVAHTGISAVMGEVGTSDVFVKTFRHAETIAAPAAAVVLHRIMLLRFIVTSTYNGEFAGTLTWGTGY